MIRDRYETRWPGLIWLDVDPEREWTELGGDGWFRPAHMPPGPGRLVHVMSSAASGEIRSYVWSRGRLYLRSPCYTGRWADMDAEVARVLGAEVAPYTVSAGGEILAAVEAPSASGRVGVGEQVGLFG